MTLTQRIGDSKTHSIPLAWNGRPFVPGDAWYLIWTLKSDPDTQPDTQAVIQKTSGAGLLVTGSKANVSLVPHDTAAWVEEGTPDINHVEKAPGTYYWDVQARSYDDGSIRSVASGALVLVRDVTREIDTSIPIHTTQPPLPGQGGGGSTVIDGGHPDSTYEQITPLDGGTP